jgi:hypothetical protein
MTTAVLHGLLLHQDYPAVQLLLKFGVLVAVVQAHAVVWAALQAVLVHTVKKLFQSFLAHVTIPALASAQIAPAVAQVKGVVLHQ